jgi:hypothetical protein
MDQPSLMPPSLEELIPEDYFVRVVNRVSDDLNLEQYLFETNTSATTSSD